MTPALRQRVLLALLVCVWAASWPVMKIGVAIVPPIWFGCLRYVIGATFLFAIGAVGGAFVIPKRQDWPLVLISGTLQMAAFSVLTGVALTLVPPGRASTLAYTTPLWVVPLAAWRLNEPISRRALSGAATGLVGAFTIAGPSLRAGWSEQAMGYAMLMGAAALWAVSIVYVRTHRFAATPLELAPWQMLLAALLLLPVAYLTEGRLNTISETGALTLAYVGLIATAFAYWAIVEAGRHLQASTMSVALLATPCLGIFLSAMALGETIDLSLIGGVTLIGTGICLATDLGISPLRRGARL